MERLSTCSVSRKRGSGWGRNGCGKNSGRGRSGWSNSLRVIKKMNSFTELKALIASCTMYMYMYSVALPADSHDCLDWPGDEAGSSTNSSAI